MKRKHIVLIIILVAANLLMVGWLMSRHGNSHPQSYVIPVRDSGHLPALDLYDDQGQIISTAKLKGSPLFVQFIDAQIKTQVDSIIRTVQNRPSRSPVWLLITDSANLLRSRLPIDDITIIERDYDALRNIFGAQRGMGSWFIFDEAGKLKAQGKYDTGDAVGHLHSILDGQPEYSAALFLKILNSLNASDKLSDAHVKSAKTRSGKAVFVLFSSACTGCKDASLVELINSYSKRFPRIWFQALLPNTFGQQDIDNFKTNLNIPFAVAIASGDLSQEWLALCDRYGEKVVNGTVIAIEKGKVVSAANGLTDTRYLLESFAGAL